MLEGPFALASASTQLPATSRPPLARRKFHSDAVESAIAEFKSHCGDAELSLLFENCLPNTLDTTVDYSLREGKPDTYVITGDIDAMWLRDSSAQVHPYIPFCKNDPALSKMIEGLIRRHSRCILLDPYANAFYKDSSRISGWKSDMTDMKPGVHERKWELDSLCYPIRLAYSYWKETGNSDPFDDVWLEAMKTVLDTMTDQQRKSDKGKYKFLRRTETQTDTLPGAGYGNPVKYTGMVCSCFRNSDDAAIYLYNIPENLFALTSLAQLAEMLQNLKPASNLHMRAMTVAKDIKVGIMKYGMVDHPEFGMIYVYECDGYGNTLLMDDAGVPGLVSLTYLARDFIDITIYNNTRKFAFSSSNPYFYKGTQFEGLGSPHLAWKGDLIWPMGIAMRGLTSEDESEISMCLQMLKESHSGKYFMHEGFVFNDPKQYTREWFAWANSLFGEFAWKVYKEHPALLKK